MQSIESKIPTMNATLKSTKPSIQSQERSINSEPPTQEVPTIREQKQQAPVMTERTFKTDDFAKAYKDYIKNCHIKSVLDYTIKEDDIEDEKLDAIIEERQKYNDNIKYFEGFYGQVLQYIFRRQLSPLDTFGYQVIYKEFEGCRFNSQNVSELINKHS